MNGIKNMALVNKIKNKVKSLAVDWLISVGLRFNQPILVAFAISLVAGRKDKSKEITALAFGRSIFTHDIKALDKFSGRISYLVIHRRYFSLIFDHFINGPDRKKITENNYYTENYCQDGKRQYYDFLKKMFPTLKKLIGFDVVLSANFGYLNQQEFAKICLEKDVPFIVLHKEGIAVQDSFDDYVRQFKDRKFIGSKIIFYNNLIKQAFLRVSITGMTEDKMAVAGIPRLDYYFTDNPEPEKKVIFFSFFPKDKFRYQALDEKTFQLVEEESEQFHKLVMEFAKNHPDIKVTVMTKLSNHYVEYVKNILNKYFKESIENLIITNFTDQGDPLDFVKQSIAVIGFHSTTLIEAIAADRVVISPDFRGIVGEKAVDYFKDYPSLINYAKTLEDLEKYILNHQKYLNIDPEIKRKFLEELIYTPDGQASIRAENFIIETVNK